MTPDPPPRKRGRPADALTANRRKAVAYVKAHLGRHGLGTRAAIGEMVRTCGFADRSSAKRALRWAIKYIATADF